MVRKKFAKFAWTYTPEALFFASLILPAANYGHDSTLKYMYGLGLFIMGPLGVFAAHFSWLANFALLKSRLKVKTDEDAAFIYAAISIALALTFLCYKEIPIGDDGMYEYHVSIGYYIWLLSMVTALTQAKLTNIKR